MKRFLIVLLITFLIILGSTVFAFANQEVTVYLNDEKFLFDVKPIIEDTRVLVPMRAIFEELGADVEWDAQTGTVVATKDSDRVRLIVGETTAYKNSDAVKLDVPAKLIDGRTLVPLRFVSEALGADVLWDPQDKSVYITQLLTLQVTEKQYQAAYEMTDSDAVLKIPGFNIKDHQGLPDFETRYIGYSKYVIRFSNSYGNVLAEQIIVNDGLVKQISISRDEFTKMTTIVIESAGKLYFKYDEANEYSEFEMRISADQELNKETTSQSESKDPLYSSAVSVKTIGDQAAALALEFLGTKYVWGGSSPSGFDCSGLVYYVYKQFGIYLPRVAANQAKSGTYVSMSNLKPGDLVFFYTDKSRPNYVAHTGMYIGNGQFIHASSSKTGVIISGLFNSWYTSVYQGARRYWE